jgi:hypothetical protein
MKPVGCGYSVTLNVRCCGSPDDDDDDDSQLLCRSELVARRKCGHSYPGTSSCFSVIFFKTLTN